MKTFGAGQRAFLAVLAVGALAIAACGGDDDDAGGSPDTTVSATTAAASTSAGGPTTAAATTVPVDVDPTGVVVIGTALDSVGGAQLDPIDTVINSDENWMAAIYGTLLRESVSGELVPWLAKSVDVVDPQTVKVVLNDGVKFSDGTPYDAAAVRRGILRNRDEAAGPAVLAGRNFTFAQLGDIVVDSPLTLTFTLKTPLAGEFLQVLAGRESAVPSPKSLDAGVDPSVSPVGAGPYKLEKFEPAKILSVRKNPDFFQADEFPLGGIDWVQATGEALQNGLLAHQLDLGVVAQTQSVAFANNPQFEKATVGRDFDYYIINFCRTKPPFDDIRVRKAVQLAIDRDEVNTAWLGGEGAVAYGFWPEGHRYFTDDSKQYAKHDVAAAKALVAETGVTEVTFDLYQPFASNPAHARLAEIIQGQLAEAGIKANILFVQNYIPDFYEPQKPGALMNTGSRPGVDRVAKLFQKGFQQALCGSSDDQIMAWANEAASLDPADPKVPGLWAQIDERMEGEAFTVFLVKSPLFYVWDTDKVGGTPEFTGQKGLLRFDSIYVKK